MSRQETTRVVGIDCATDPRKVGLACASLTSQGVTVTAAVRGESHGQLLEVIHGWLHEVPRALLALDAPLGWPAVMGEALVGHRAGAPLDIEPNRLFRRETDRFVHRVTGRLPLDVGADRIARTALAALGLLQGLREALDDPLPLVWTPDYVDRIGVIEVYPAATLRLRGLRHSGYKDDRQVDLRNEMVAGLREHGRLDCDVALLTADADVLDAVVCTLAAADFLSGRAMAPEDQVLARKEGWIWVAA